MLLPIATLQDVFRACTALELDLDAARLAVHRDYARNLPRRSDPGSQLWSDLLHMNQVERLEDGSVPLRDWLSTAALLGGPRVEVEVLRQALRQLEGAPREAATPKPNPDDPTREAGAKVEALRRLLREMFDAGELRRLVVRLPDGTRLAAELPGATASSAEVVEVTVQVLLRHKALDKDFFELLIQERPRRRAEILAVRAMFLG